MRADSLNAGYETGRLMARVLNAVLEGMEPEQARPRSEYRRGSAGREEVPRAHGDELDQYASDAEAERQSRDY
jgi:hypothetical protein